MKENNISIVYGRSFLNFKEDTKPTHNINTILIDNFGHMVTIIIQKGLKVETVEMTMENAEKIGFINPSALKEYCKLI